MERENKDLVNLLIKCKTLVKHFKQSVLSNEKLTKAQMQMCIELLHVKKDVPTR